VVAVAPRRVDLVERLSVQSRRVGGGTRNTGINLNERGRRLRRHQHVVDIEVRHPKRKLAAIDTLGGQRRDHEIVHRPVDRSFAGKNMNLWRDEVVDID